MNVEAVFLRRLFNLLYMPSALLKHVILLMLAQLPPPNEDDPVKSQGSLVSLHLPGSARSFSLLLISSDYIGQGLRQLIQVP